MYITMMSKILRYIVPVWLLFAMACSKYDGLISGETICEGFVKDQVTGEPVGGLVLQFEMESQFHLNQQSVFDSFGTIYTDENGYFFLRFTLERVTNVYYTNNSGRIRAGFDTHAGLSTIATFVPGELNHFEIEWP